jgi:hypothetical protein
MGMKFSDGGVISATPALLAAVFPVFGRGRLSSADSKAGVRRGPVAEFRELPVSFVAWMPRDDKGAGSER